jgi:hypothetical protein
MKPAMCACIALCHKQLDLIMKMRNVFVAAVMFAVAMLSWLPIHAAPAQQNQTWSQPVLLSRPGEAAWFSDILVDATGRIHVAWSGDSLPEYDAVWYTTSRDGFAWQPPNDIVLAAPWGELTRPSMAVDDLGNMVMTHRRRNLLSDAYAHADKAYSGSAWELGQMLNNDQVPYFSRVMVDEKRRIHLVFTEAVLLDACECYRVYYRRSDDWGRSWTGRVELSDPTTGAAKPQIVMDKKGSIHVVWESGKGGSYGQLTGPTQVMYAKSSDNGETWTAPFTFPAANEGKKVAIAVDGSNRLVVAWQGMPENQIFYQVSVDEGVSWSSPQSLPGAQGAYVTALDIMSMATDAAGHVHLTFIGNRSDFVQSPNDKPTFSVMHVAWDGSKWTEPEIITQVKGDVPEWPRIAVGLGNQVHVTWFTRDEANVFGNVALGAAERFGYKVWYSQRTVDAPAIAPIIYPTSTPVPTATPEPLVQAAEPTLPALLDRTPSSVDYQSLRTEVDDYPLLLLSGLPVALLFLVSYLVIRRRRA